MQKDSIVQRSHQFASRCLVRKTNGILDVPLFPHPRGKAVYTFDMPVICFFCFFHVKLQLKSIIIEIHKFRDI